jgi:hypothetical protein
VNSGEGDAAVGKRRGYIVVPIIVPSDMNFAGRETTDFR